MRPAELPRLVSWPQRSGLIRWSSWALAGATLFALGLTISSAIPPFWLVAAFLICLAGFLSVPWALARGRSPRIGGLLLLGSAAALIIVGTLAQGRLDAPHLVLLTFLPVAGFVLLDGRAAWAMAAWICGLIAGLVLLGGQSTLLAATEPGSAPRWAMAVWLVVGCLSIAFVTGLYDRGLAKLSHQQYIYATRDHLTGLVNRRRFEEVFEEECRRAARSNLPLALILLDIDHFKSFNDTYGHPRGDLCLIAVSYAMSTCMRRAGDLAARYGGEEFVVLVPEATQTQALQIAESIRDAVQQMRIPHEGSPRGLLTVSLGVAAGAEPGQVHPDKLVERVDKALYLAKQGGRDQTVVAPDET